MKIEGVIMLMFAIVILLIATRGEARGEAIFGDINRHFNDKITFQLSDSWDIIDERGDCKAHAKAKFLALEEAGYKPRFVYGKLGGVNHVTVKVKGLYLDNNYDKPVKKIENFIVLYEFDRKLIYMGGKMVGKSDRLLKVVGL